MERSFYTQLAQRTIEGETPKTETCVRILEDPNLELLPLLDAAYQVKKHFCGKTIKIHILNNVQNGACPEDCSYCAQGKSSEAEIEKYVSKSDDEIIKEAERAYESGAYRYCMVYSGTGPSEKRATKIAALVQKIKKKYPIQVCVSAGIMDPKSIGILKESGLDRLNHNLNTSRSRYPSICTTHSYQDRIDTLQHASAVGLQICSGIIAGMGESTAERVELAMELKKVNAQSIPVNFLIPIPGNALTQVTDITPQTALRLLCLFRFVNPDAEIRAAAGREEHLRSMEVMSLYPANSLFLDGYLNTKGSHVLATLQMIKDAGFDVESTKDLDELIAKAKDLDEGMDQNAAALPIASPCSKMKTARDLHPTRS